MNYSLGGAVAQLHASRSHREGRVCQRWGCGAAARVPVTPGRSCLSAVGLWRSCTRPGYTGKVVFVSGGAVAQLGARLDGIEEVVGSNPISSTKLVVIIWFSDCGAR